MIIFYIFEHFLNHISFSIVLIFIIIFLITFLIGKIIELDNSSKKGIIVIFLCTTGLLITRWVHLGFFPLNNFYESLIFLSWSLVILHMYLFFKNNHFIRIMIELFFILIQIFASLNIFTELKNKYTTIIILVPALQSYWLMMHVSMILFGYASLLCGSFFSITRLVITFEQKGKKFFLKSNFIYIYIYYFGEIKKNIIISRNFLQKYIFFYIRNFYRYQLIQQLDHWSFRIIQLGFCFLTIGIISGSVWANETWGSYWQWDPKETWSFITWTIFTIYLHIQINIKMKDNIISSILSFLGFILIWICYFGVNVVEIGMHSYGSF